MIKSIPAIEVKIGEKVFTLLLPTETSLGEVHDALFQMRTIIVNRIVEVNESDKKKEETKEE